MALSAKIFIKMRDKMFVNTFDEICVKILYKNDYRNTILKGECRQLMKELIAAILIMLWSRED